MPLLLIQQRFEQFYLLVGTGTCPVDKEPERQPTTRTTIDTIKDARENAPEFKTSFISPPQCRDVILPLLHGKEISGVKRLPGNKFIDGANTAEKLYILIAHDIKHLRPQQQAYYHHDAENDPSKFFTPLSDLTSYVAKLS